MILTSTDIAVLQRSGGFHRLFVTKSNAEFSETGVHWMTCVPASCAIDDAYRFLVFVIVGSRNRDAGKISGHITQVFAGTTLSVHKALNDWKPVRVGTDCYVAMLIAQMHSQGRLWTFIRTARLASRSQCIKGHRSRPPLDQRSPVAKSCLLQQTQQDHSHFV